MRAELGRLAAALGAAADGTQPTPVELAELLWLAQQLPGADAAPPEPQPEPGPRPEPPPAPPPLSAPAAPDGVPPSPHPTHPPQAPPPAPEPPRPEPARVPLYLDPAPTPASLLAPAPPMLRHPLALQRALRPLKRYVPSAAGRPVLDEAATVDRIARLDAGPDTWLPVLRPASERWLRLALVHDTGPTMPIWRPLLRELHAALVQSGIFRTVSVHRATPDGRVPRLTLPRDGRTAVLLLSDCTGPQWHRGSGAAAVRWFRTLHKLAARAPLAVLQPLPEHLWRTTALPAVPGRFASPYPASPLPALRFTPYAAEDADDRPPGSLALPVLEAAPRWLAHWSRLTGAPGGAHVPGAAAWLTSGPPAAPAAPAPARGPEDLVRAFRATASPEAFRLAGHLAVGTPHLPVMRLVHAALEPDPRPQHLAEVILSGLLATVPGPPGSYAFRTGVRDLLLRSLPRSARGRTTAFLARVGGLIDERAGAGPGEFRARTRGVEGEAFATVSEESVRRLSSGRRALGGRYRLLRQLRPNSSMWQARDLDLDRPVAVKLHRPRDHGEFLRAARALARLSHPDVARVLDFGFTDDGPYTVLEHLDGVPLNTLAAPNAYRLPGNLLDTVARSLARALTALHEAGVAHGAVGMTRVTVLPDGSVKLGQFDPGRTPVLAERADDLSGLADLLHRLGAPPTDLAAPDPALRAAALAGLALGSPAMPEGPRHTYELLGPLRVTRTPPGGTSLPVGIGTPEQEALLSMLLLKPGNVVTHADLDRGIRGGRTPEHGPSGTAVLVARLRRDLHGIATLPEGYALHTSADTIDIARCQSHVTAAEDLRTAGDLRAARGHISAALALFRGTPLDGVPGPAARTARTRLTHLQLTLQRTAAELDLDLGEFEDAATHLDTLVHAHPSREDFRRLQMIALHRLGRTGEALEAYEEYEELGGRTGPALEELHRELREARARAGAEARAHTTAVFRFADGAPPSGAAAALGRAVAQLVVEAGLGAREHGLLPVADGFDVLVKTAPAARRLLAATLTGLQARLWEIPGSPRLVVAFWPTAESERPDTDTLRADLDAADADAGVTVSPGLYWTLPDDRRTELHPSGTPAAYWHGVLHLPRTAIEDTDDPDDADEPPVRGPHPMPNDGSIPRPATAHTVIVYRRPDRSLTLTPPDETDLTWEFYEVERGERTMPVRAGGLDVRASVRVDDPLEAALTPVLPLAAALAERLETEAARLPAPLDMDKLHRRLDRWPVPGYAVRWHLPETDPRPAADGPAPGTRAPAEADRRDDLTRALSTAESYLLGFDGLLLRLYAGTRDARDAARELTALAAELRDPDDALSGRPLERPLELELHPLDVLRSFAGRPRVARPLSERLDAIELRALRTARPAHDADLLVRTLNSTGRPVAVVSDVSPHVISAYLRSRSLEVRAGVHGRTGDPALLMPRPDALHRALHRPDTPTPHGVLIGTSPAELRAAFAIGLPFVAYAPTPAAAARLTELGAQHVVRHLTELIDAVR
ncbi:SAV_2336 N-terminal domain-related protein [Streptomyces sp. NPDC050264]|uniref:SAV_2336 N-terminal domain-related protein n=1 Tax=Streptomyces sp. NPDC050264 TaxID=3155038 RepID=UPI003436EED5